MDDTEKLKIEYAKWEKEFMKWHDRQELCGVFYWVGFSGVILGLLTKGIGALYFGGLAMETVTFLIRWTWVRKNHLRAMDELGKVNEKLTGHPWRGVHNELNEN